MTDYPEQFINGIAAALYFLYTLPMLETEAKSILYKFQSKLAGSNNEWFGLDYTMNLYRGCCHGCIYCDSRSECYRIKDFDTVRIKKDCVNILAKELKNKRSKGVIGIGSMSDPYNPFESMYEYTRKALGWVDYFRFGISIITKSSLIARDVDLLTDINRHSPVIAKLTITAADDSLAKRIEPYASSSSERFAALKTLTDAGIVTGVMLMPVLPFITDSEENIAQIVELSAENGARFIYPAFGVTLRQNQRNYFYEKLDKLFCGVKDKYINAFGGSYLCESPNSKKLMKLFEAKCDQLGILYKMEDIIRAYRTEKDAFF